MRSESSGTCSRDQHQVGVERARAEGHVERVGVGVEGGHEDRGAVDARLPQDVVGGGVAEDVEVGRVVEAVLVAVDEDDVLARAGQLVGGRPAHPAEAADDDVPGQSVDLALHAAPPHE